MSYNNFFDIVPGNLPNFEITNQQVTIQVIKNIKNYIFIKLSNGQNFLTDGKNVYDASNYEEIKDIFIIDDKPMAYFQNFSYQYIVDLTTKDTIFEDKNSYSITKNDERTLEVLMKIGGGNTKIYDIEAKKYLPSPEDYEFEHSLGNNLYVFVKTSDQEFHDQSRLVMDINGNTILKDITGWVDLCDNHLIINQTNQLLIVNLNDKNLTVHSIAQDSKIITKPLFENDKLVIIEKGKINIYYPSLELKDSFEIDELTEVLDQEIIMGVSKILIPYTINGEQINKHLFVDLETGKHISHIRIEPYPYWRPNTYIAQDTLDSDITNYHFYDKTLEKVTTISAYSYESIDVDECIFLTRGKGKNQLVNTINKKVTETEYDYITFHLTNPYGYGINSKTKTMDFLDTNLEILIPNVDFSKLDLQFSSSGYTNFNYFIVNDYLCIIKRFIDSFGQDKYRTFLQTKDGNIILDSTTHACVPIGDFIQIVDSQDNTSFLNTLTGEVGQLSLNAPTDENGNINLEQIQNLKNLLAIETTSNSPLLLEKQIKKDKKNNC